jgi:hypothetical protein
MPSLQYTGIADVASSLGKNRLRNGEIVILHGRKYCQRLYEVLRKRLESPQLITGSDLIAFGMEPGPEMGRFPAILRSSQDTGEISTREDAIALARSLLAKRT